jgi:hypothetical protein
MRKLLIAYTGITLLVAGGLEPAKAFDLSNSRADFLDFAKELSAMGARQGHPLSAEECDQDGCSRDTNFQPDGNQWVSVSYIWGNGPGKRPDHRIVLICSGKPSDYPYRTCYNSDGMIFRQKIDGGQFHLEKIIRNELPSWKYADCTTSNWYEGCGE